MIVKKIKITVNLMYIWRYLEEIMMSVLLSSMVIIMGVQIIARYVFSNSLTWSEEVARYLFIWSGFFSISFCFKNNSSIKISKFIEILPKPVKKIVYILIRLILILFYVFLLLPCKNILAYSLWSGQSSPAMNLLMFWIYLAPLVGFFLGTCRLIEEIYADIKFLSFHHD